MSKVHPMRFALLATVAGTAMLTAGAAFAADESIVTQRSETQVAQAAPAAAAPAAGDGMLEEIIVSGFRQSIQASIEQKRNATQIVEVITAEDIGKLPDNSIAESIARLPGLAAQRIDGRAQSISLRGLGPDFTTTLLNGREQVTTGNNRSVEFDQYPAEISSGVAVYKTSQSNVIGQGLAGTVDLKTIRPLDYKERVLSVSARTEYVTNGKLNSDSDEYGYRFSGTYIDRFANDTMGISLGVSHLMQPTQIKSARFWGDGNYPGSGTQAEPWIIGGGEFRSNSQTLKRTGVVATWQWEASDNFTSTTDFYYSKFDDVQYQRGVELPLFWSGATLATAGRTLENGLITAGSFSGVKGVGRSDIRTTKADLYSAGWNGEYNKDAWTVTGDIGYSSADRKSSRFEAYYGTGRGRDNAGATDTVGFTSTPNDFGWQLTKRLNYADPNLMLLTDPGGWSGNSLRRTINGTDYYLDQNGYLNTPTIDDELWSARMDVKREIESNAFSAISVGANYTDRQKNYTQPEWYVVTTANVQNPTAQRSVAVPASSVLKPTDLSWIGLGDTLAFDPRDLLANGTYSLIKCPRNNCVNDLAYQINEKVWTGYAKVDLDAMLGQVKLTGNIGAQYVHTDQSSTGPAISSTGTFSIRTDGAKYYNFLPSANLIFTMPNEDHKIRMAASRQMARARPDQLSALSTFSFNAAFANNTSIDFSPWSAGGDGNGNPKLKPWVADAIDATYEYYFADAGYFALNTYYKWLKTYIYNERQVLDFTGFDSGGITPRIFQGYSNLPANGNGGDIYGFELALSLPFDIINERLDGFGLTSSFGYTKTSIQPNPGDPAQPIPGFSKYTSQATFYYDKDGFQARISANHRSKFLAEVTGFGQSRALRMGKGETIYDAQVSYEFQEGSSLQGLTLMLQGYNLSNEPFIAYGRGDTRLVERFEDYGSRYLLGASYKF